MTPEEYNASMTSYCGGVCCTYGVECNCKDCVKCGAPKHKTFKYEGL